jgi:hypothetical protein
MYIAVKYIYGFDFPWRWGSGSLFNLSRVVRVAEKYEIAGLSETVFEAARRRLADCVSDEATLEEFLEPADMWNDPIITNIPWFAVAVKILGQNLTAIRKQAVFQKLLEQVPKLALDLLNLVAEEKENDELEEKTGRKECKKKNRRRLAVSELQQRVRRRRPTKAQLLRPESHEVIDHQTLHWRAIDLFW